MSDNNKLVVSLEDTKDVLALVIALSTAVKASQADGKFTIGDLPNFVPVLFKIGPAISGVENVKIELKAATKEQAEELKAWVIEKVDGAVTTEHAEKFIEDAFAVVLDLWMVIKTYFIESTVTDVEGSVESEVSDVKGYTESEVSDVEPIS